MEDSDNEAGFKIDRKLSTASRFSVIDSVGANSTAYTDFGVRSSRTYHYRVWAHNAIDSSGYSNIDTVSTRRLPPPPKPNSLTAQATSATEIQLSWTDNSDNELGFEISRRTRGASLAVVDSVGADVTTYTDSGLSPQTRYVYRVRAFNQNGRSDRTNNVAATTLPTSPLPAKPDSLTAQAVSSTQILLYWTDNSDNELGFEIRRRTPSDQALAVIDSVGANVTEYTDSGLSPHTQYNYRVLAYNASGLSSMSNSAVVKPSPPAAPSSLTAEVLSATEISLSWTDNADNEREFRIERKFTSASDSTYSQVGTASENATTYADGDLQEGTGYTYRVLAHNAGGNSEHSGTAAATTRPHAPTDLAGSVSMTTVNLSWTDNSSVETGYEVERKTGDSTSAASYAPIGSAAENATAYADSGLQWETTYTYRVRASVSGVYSSYSNTYTVTTPDSTGTPPPPSSLSASAASSTQINLSWRDNANNETGFKIERRLSTQTDADFSQVDTTGVNVESYTDSGLTPSTAYIYRVRAYNTAGNSAYSNADSATTPPLPPSTLSARTVSSTQIRLSWTDESAGESGFRIERKLSSAVGDTSYSHIATADSNSTTYADSSGLEEVTSYTYRVRAYNAGGNSDYSNTATTTSWPHAPTDLDGSVSMRTVSLSWTDKSLAETDYEVERKTGTASSTSTYARIGSTATNVTTYSDPGLQWNTTYTYRVRASTLGYVYSSYSNTYTVTTPDSTGTPPPPSSLSASAASTSQIDLRWKDNSNDETGFKIERRLSTESDADFSQIDTTAVNDTTYADSGLSASTTYIYRVRAYNTEGNSGYSGTARGTTLPPTPTLSAEAVSSTQISLNWKDNSNDETGFKIERKRTSAGDGTYSQVATASANDTTYTDSGLREGTSYSYRVRAYNAGGNSAYSNAAAATTWPHAPTDLDGSVSMTTVSLSWSDESTVETGYEIERKAGTAGSTASYAPIGSAAANAATYSDSGLQWNTTYTYRVRASMSDIHSSYSDTYTVTTPDSTGIPPPGTPDVPATPSALSAEAQSTTSVLLRWTDNSDNETGFKIERRLSTGTDADFSQIDTTAVSDTTYTDSGLDEGTSYKYRVRAFNSVGNSAYSNADSATTHLTLPDAPSSLSAGATSPTQISLSWSDNSDNEDGFRIERKLTPAADSTFSRIGMVGEDTKSYTDGGLASGTGYTYRVYAFNEAGDSDYSNQASATTRPTRPAAPFSLTATAQSSSRILLGWKDASHNEAGFKIERKLTTAADSTYSEIGTAGTNAETYTDSGLSASTGYTYRVRAHNTAGNSDYSGEASATTQAPSPPPATPSGLSATATSSSQIDLTWTDESDNEDGFKVERKLSTESDADFSQIGMTVANDTTYTDSGLSPSTTYVYRVRAFNDSGDSGYSGTDLATTPSASNLPKAPSSLSASAVSSSRINLSWTDNSDNETGFKIERKLMSASDSTFSQIGRTNANGTTYSDSSLDEGTGYKYRVRAYNDSGNSVYSGTASATTHVTIPSAPSSLSASARSSSQIDLSWTDNSDNETGFKIERKLTSASDSTFSQIGTAGANARSYTDGGLSASMGYTYRVRAYNTAGNSGYSRTASATTRSSRPAAPFSLTATAKSSSRIDLGWKDASNNETGFKIERKLTSASDNTFSQIGTASAGAESYTDSGLSASTGYTYRVRAYNSVGNSDYSDTASATTQAPPPPPSAPSSLSATAKSSSRIDLSWDDNSDDESGFKIERRLSTGSDSDFSQVGTTSANDTTYTDSGLSASTAYVYRVRAYNANGNSGYSGTARATTKVAVPSAPSSLAASARSATSVRLRWKDNSDNESGFKIERKLSTQNNASFSQIGTASANDTTYTDSGLSANTGYTYRVRAYNSGGNSDYSATASATTNMALPASPSDLSASARSSSSIRLSWDDRSDNETGFKIERRLSSGSDSDFRQIGTANAGAELYTDSGLSASTGYTYRVRAYNSAGNSGYSGTASATTRDSLPSAPSSLTATAKSSSRIDLGWKDTSNNESGFKIERKLSTQTDANFSQIGTANAGAKSYTDSGLSASTGYTYRVRAYNSVGNSSYSGTASATTKAPPPPPDAPSALSATAKSSSQIDLSWDDNSDDETGFKIERRLSTSSSFSQIDTTSANDTDYTDSGLSASTTYVYRVRAYNANGNSSYSGTDRATTQSNLPRAPSSLSATAKSSSRIDLGWTDNSDNETGFKIERKLSSAANSSFRQVGTTSANDNDYSDSGLSEGTGYTYRVRAYNASGNSVYSASASATTKVSIPSAPSSLSASVRSATTIRLSWTDNASNESGFKIERKLSSAADSTFSQVGTASANARSYTDSGLSASTGYTYRVRAYNSAGNSSYSGTASATTKATPPSTPSSLTATAKSSSRIDLGWKDTSSNESGFKIERKLSSAANSSFSQIGTASANAESYTNSGLSVSTGYTYRIRAYNSAGNSSYSGTASATTKAPSPPAAPSGLAADVQSSSSVDLSWDDNSNNETGFKIERRLSTEDDDDFSQIGTTGANDNDYTDSGLSPSTTYIYRVRAYNDGGNSSYSGTDRATTLAAARVVAEIFEYDLESSHPNPFREHATIVYTLPEMADVRLELFNILGQQVRTLIDAARPPGRNEITWNGRDGNGRMVSSGVYILRMTAGDFVEYRKITFLK
ncbi:MAG: fibronectin type III domain-containing protein [Gemmatimonadetes bacterium]|nr:fibronectin type III domain-containing protein [Gemmatimonadota bacterium]